MLQAKLNNRIWHFSGVRTIAFLTILHTSEAKIFFLLRRCCEALSVKLSHYKELEFLLSYFVKY